MAGLPGTGKSTLARELAKRLEAVVLDKDQVRAALFPPEEIEYSRRQDDVVIEAIYKAAAFLLAKGRVVIMDGRPFLRREQVDRAAQFARECGARMAILLCECADEVAQARLESDAVGGRHIAANRDFKLYLELKEAAEPIPLPHWKVDTGQRLETCVQECINYIKTIQE